jgi:hypothetical protein
VSPGDTLQWSYDKDISNNGGLDAGWLDEVTIHLPEGVLSEALDNYNLQWESFGEGRSWIGQTAISFDGEDSAESTLSHNQFTLLQTTAPATGTLSYYWKTSSEENNDLLTFSVNFVEKDQISGETGWERKSFVVSASDTLRWTFIRDRSGDGGDNTAWVDRVEFDLFGDIYRPTPDEKEIDLSDAIVVLQILCGINTDNIYLEGDVNGDGKVSMEEAIYILEIVSGVR